MEINPYGFAITVGIVGFVAMVVVFILFEILFALRLIAIKNIKARLGLAFLVGFAITITYILSITQ